MRPVALWSTADAPPTAEERDLLAETLDQLERAELYIVAALDLQADDPWRWRLLEDLRAQLVAVRRSLARPRSVVRDGRAAS